MAMTRCLDCGRRTRGSRCPACTRRYDDWQTRRRMPNGWKWGEIRTRVHERDQACVRCGLAPVPPGTPPRPTTPAAATISPTSSCSAPAATLLNHQSERQRLAGARSEPSAARAYLLLHGVVAEDRQRPKWGLLGRRPDARPPIAVAVK